MEIERLRDIVEGAIMTAGEPVSIDKLIKLFDRGKRPSNKQLRSVLNELTETYSGRGIELKEVASGFRFQIKSDLSPWISKLWEERPPRYSRALLETLSLIAYRQPITRAEIEDVRGVAVSTNIIRTLLEREWVRVVGHKDVPGKPALLATTKDFLDYFNLKSLDQLPTLSELKDINALEAKLGIQLAMDVKVVAGGDMEGDDIVPDELDDDQADDQSNS